jgi:hypothetical protein
MEFATRASKTKVNLKKFQPEMEWRSFLLKGKKLMWITKFTDSNMSKEILFIKNHFFIDNKP